MRKLLAILIFASCVSAFGQTTTSCGEATQTGVDSGNSLAQLGTPCTTGSNSGGYTVSSVSYWVGTPTSTSFALGVFSSSSGSPTLLLCSASTGTITPTSGWNTVNISGCPTLSPSTTYWVAYITGSDAIGQGTVSAACPGTSYHSTWTNAGVPSVSMVSPFPANAQGKSCYSVYMTLAAATTTGSSLAITTTSLTSGQVGTAYSATLAATGGTTPYTWSLTSGTLPAGLTLNATTGAITGTPTASANATSLTFKVTDSSSPVQTKSVTLSLTISAATLSITTTSLPGGQVGTAYSTTLAATGGTTPYTWSLTSGTLPAGLTLNATTGAITGTPTAIANATSLTFKVTDSGSPVQTKSVTLSLTISAATLSITTTSLPGGQVGTAYSATLAATGGTTPYTWSLTSGTLPAGLYVECLDGRDYRHAHGGCQRRVVDVQGHRLQLACTTQSVTLSLTISASDTVDHNILSAQRPSQHRLQHHAGRHWWHCTLHLVLDQRHAARRYHTGFFHGHPHRHADGNGQRHVADLHGH